ncbi:DUF2155 domain-containing protein [Oleisolibacter albus]|uniref:DUF2155 domain-containing protein n=1 Tax=Oleisolibacter albus TaxID=2171757 RepID=UPI001EFDFFE8|nr:DUF2155 domain-containing protein [Oleisolibacter albus]
MSAEAQGRAARSPLSTLLAVAGGLLLMIPGTAPAQDAAPPAPAAAGEMVPPSARPEAPPAPERQFDDMAVAELQGLDKITARISSFTVPVGQTGRFGQLQVTVRACKKAPPIDPPESAAFLEITELRPDEGPAAVFRGWMFASSPAVSAMDHPVYDVWVVDCKSAATRSSSPKAG